MPVTVLLRECKSLHCSPEALNNYITHTHTHTHTHRVPREVITIFMTLMAFNVPESELVIVCVGVSEGCLAGMLHTD